MSSTYLWDDGYQKICAFSIYQSTYSNYGNCKQEISYSHNNLVLYYKLPIYTYLTQEETSWLNSSQLINISKPKAMINIWNGVFLSPNIHVKSFSHLAKGLFYSQRWLLGQIQPDGPVQKRSPG